jgi:hypothetical protein
MWLAHGRMTLGFEQCDADVLPLFSDKLLTSNGFYLISLRITG